MSTATTISAYLHAHTESHGCKKSLGEDQKVSKETIVRNSVKEGKSNYQEKDCDNILCSNMSKGVLNKYRVVILGK